MLRLKIGILTTLMMFSVMVLPGVINAQLQPQISSEFVGKNVTTSSDWKLPVPANVGDTIRYRVTITNADGTNSARGVTVFVKLPDLGTKLILSPVSYVKAENTKARDAFATTELVDKYNYGLEYIPGTSRVIRGGSSQTLSPDTEYSNLTLTAVKVGDIVAGSSNAVAVEFEAKVVEGVKKVKAASVTPTPTATPTPTESPATGSAVAVTAPETGLTDPIWINTLGFAGVGLGGVGLRVLAGKLRRKADQDWIE